MAYSAFNTTIFSSPAINTICNKMVDSVIDNFSNDALNTFALTGCVADYFQGPTVDRTVNTVSFITSDIDVFIYLMENISNLIGVKNVITYIDRLQITTSEDVFLEVWFSSDFLTIVDYSGISLLHKDEIYANTMWWDVDSTPSSEYLPLEYGTPYFNPGSRTLYNQGWKFAEYKVAATWLQGTAVPDNITIATTIKNYETDPEFNRFSDFRVRVISNQGSGDGLTNHFFSAALGGVYDYDLATEPLFADTEVEFINFNVLDAGSYQSTIQFQVSAYYSKVDRRVVVENRILPIELLVLGEHENYTEPGELSFSHTIDENLPAPVTFYVNVLGSYTLNFAKIFSITGRGLVDESTKKIYVKRANGKQSFTVYLNNTVEFLGAGSHTSAITIKHSDGQLILPVNIFISPTNEITVEPNFFSFESIIGVKEASRQHIRIVSPLPYTYEIPPWLYIAGIGSQNLQGLVDPVDSVNFFPGTYEGNIKLTSAAGTVSIPVKYVIKANSYTDLLPSKLNFTKDQINIIVATKTIGAYIAASIFIKYFDFSGEEFSKTITTDLPIFDGKADFHPGTLVDSLMPGIKNVTDFIPVNIDSKINKPFPYYKPAVLNVKLDKIVYSNGVTLSSNTLNNILFVKGSSPVNYKDENGIAFSEHPVRVTPNSYGMFNFFKRSGLHTIKIYLNGKLEKSITHDTVLDSVFGMILSFKDYKEGDLVFVNLEGEEGTTLVKQFYVFPENIESYHIAWVTEHEQIEMLEFTGAITIGSKYKRVENTVFKNLVNVKEILDTTKEQSLTVNTGWVLKNNHVLIDSLVRSKIAWLFLPGTDSTIPLVPKSDALSNYNSERAVYAYDINFTINPENDAKVYPR